MHYPYDLHTHSSISPDAQYAPEELMRRAKVAGMLGLVITDHNTTAGWARSLAAAKVEGLQTLEGIEITSKYSGTDVHILGFSQQFSVEIMQSGLRATIDGYNERSRAIADRITAAGVAAIDFEALLKKFRNSYVSKPNIAQEIARQRQIDYREALKFVERSGVGYVPYGEWALTPQEAVDLIHRSGGIASLAHPGDFFTRSHDDPTVIRDLLFNLLADLTDKHQLDAIECRYVRHAPEFTNEMLDFAHNHNLLISGGTDWHGEAFTPGRAFGETGVTVDEFDQLKVRSN